MTTRFDEVLPRLLQWIADNPRVFSADRRSVIVRDLRGQIRIVVEIPPGSAVDTDSEKASPLGTKLDEELVSLLGRFRAAGPVLIGLPAEQGFESFFDSPDSYVPSGCGSNWRVLDRVVTGREWLYPPAPKEKHPPRLVFFGIKGGVGRSTALSMAAWWLAQKGSRVLVVDLDLEAPGLGNMLLPVRYDLREEGDTALPGWPDYGVADWFVEDAVGQADEDLLQSVVHPSPLKGTGKGEILVVPAAGGKYEQDYVSKVSRAYADVPNESGVFEVFGDRLTRALHQLEAAFKPDVVLLDSRAGIHHISAAALNRLDAYCYLFASNSDQTWAGYDALFKHWSLSTTSVQSMREKLRLVSALTSPAVDKQEFRDVYGERAYDVFVRFYDGVEPEAGANAEPLFTFGVYEDGAPHRPILVWRDPVYADFSPIRESVQVDAAKAELVFGELFEQIDSDVQEASS